ncbi:hypothetical protein [Candidatus Rhabdochlamydia sp. T3358]|uniref:hypothetical protein n=1 Tax=Candidatus Rhabdochlamydia sp. T3358 TaxID=2099795 RepID=UPI0010B3C555|nr:hypothetical protein [Candidatus Rhabdochlamydia sp. T3358]VHO04394.1 hypothetical protein RHT_01357 [Candidatus Rhabdochlamydia sp. T3358]
MKKPSLCSIVLLIILGFLAFSEIKDTITRDKVFFLVRIFCRRPGYAKKIEIKPYLLNDEQVLQSLTYPQIELQQPPRKELFLKNVNVVLRIKNHGQAVAWGTLAYKVGHINWLKIDVDLPSINSKNKAPFYEYVIPIGIAVPYNDDLPPKPIKVKWVALYVK